MKTTVHVPVTESSLGQQVYGAVRLVAAAIRAAGPNRARVRDALARSTVDLAGESGPLFDGAGNLLAKPQLVPVSAAAPQPGESGSTH
jgi:hypothetical protein